MTNVMTDEDVITLGAATESIIRHLYESATTRHGETRSFEDFFDHVLMRGRAEIERTWKSAEKTAERNKLANIAAEKLRYLRLKQKNGDELSKEELAFLDLCKDVQ